MHRIAVLLAVLGGTLAAGPAQAQLGAIFGDSPPRPPANVPNGSFPAAAAAGAVSPANLVSAIARPHRRNIQLSPRRRRPRNVRRRNSLPTSGGHAPRGTSAIQHPDAAFATASRGDIGATGSQPVR